MIWGAGSKGVTNPDHGAQTRSMVHNIALYQRSGAQGNFHKPRQIDGQTDGKQLRQAHRAWAQVGSKNFHKTGLLQWSASINNP